MEVILFLKHFCLFVIFSCISGHYVPNLSKAILDRGVTNMLNLQGFMVGNAWTDAPIDNKGAAFYWWTHALNTKETYDQIVAHCDFSVIGPLAESKANLCNQWLDVSTAEMGNINIYDIYTDVCLSPQGQTFLDALATSDSMFSPMAQALHNLHTVVDNRTLDACIDEHVEDYLNIPSVQAAIHANATKHWVQCGGVSYSRKDLLTSMLPVYQALFKTNLRMLVYSGDVDAIVPYTGTREWIASLNMTIEEPWRPWTGTSGQVGGYVTVFERLTFATVRRAGHMVPWTQPQRALDMFTRFLRGLPL
jgi:serine carboxypeptidase-like clade 2